MDGILYRQGASGLNAFPCQRLAYIPFIRRIDMGQSQIYDAAFSNHARQKAALDGSTR